MEMIVIKLVINTVNLTFTVYLHKNIKLIHYIMIKNYLIYLNILRNLIYNFTVILMCYTFTSRIEKQKKKKDILFQKINMIFF